MKMQVLLILLVTGTAPVLAQTCNSAIKTTTPTSRFIITRQGTAIDKKTGLEWMRCAAGRTWNGAACAGGAISRNWQQALNLAEAATFAGHDDWRLPNLKELMSIVEVACTNPSLNAKVFFDPAYYWSATTFAFDPAQAYQVDVSGLGYDDKLYKANARYVRLVRRALPAPAAP